MLPPLEIAAILLTATATFSWLNARIFHLPNTIALLLLGTGASMVLFLVQITTPGLWPYDALLDLLDQVDFHNLVMNGLLAFLLFAGALKVDVNRLSKRWLMVGSLATIGVFVSASIVTVGLWIVSQMFDLPLNLAWCFVFGALIAPTDPVAVLATLRSVKVPKTLEIDLSGETLFNDGIGVVLFIIALKMATATDEVTLSSAAFLFLTQAGGGVVLGLVLGYVGYKAIRLVDDYIIEIIISLAVVTATYAMAEKFGGSGPISVVVAGGLIGHLGPRHAMSDTTRQYLFGFWQVVDQILNSVLFLVIGLEILTVELRRSLLIAALAANPIVLLGRAIAVIGAVIILARLQSFPKGSVAILSWGAVRGAVPVALALSLPGGAERPYILAATYTTVLFSIVVQGLSLPTLVRAVTSQDEKQSNQSS